LEQIGGLPSDETVQALKALGHDLAVDLEPQGDVNAIGVNGQDYHGVADGRQFNGKAAAW
jgi:gamma-glutamyltranspeptidase